MCMCTREKIRSNVETKKREKQSYRTIDQNELINIRSCEHKVAKMCYILQLERAYHSGLVMVVSTTVPGGGFSRRPRLSWNIRLLIRFLTTTTANLGLRETQSMS